MEGIKLNLSYNKSMVNSYNSKVIRISHNGYKVAIVGAWDI